MALVSTRACSAISPVDPVIMSSRQRVFELPSQFGFNPLACLGVCVLLLVAVGCEPQSPSPTATATEAAGEAADEATNNEDEATVAANSESDEDGAEESASSEQVLRHAVFFSFKEESTPEEIQSVVDAFAALPGKISEIIDFQHGTNNSPEGLDDGFTHCFLLTFKDEAGRAAYLPHPAHSGEFADTLRPHMKDVFVIDYWELLRRKRSRRN